MKRYFVIIIVLLLVAVATLFVLRHEIIGHVLKITISKKTNKTITLNIGHVHYSVINSSVCFTDSKLSFHNTFVNKDKTIQLSELKFDEIKLEGLSLLHLIFNSEFIANKFVINKPSLWFRENNNPVHFKQKPEEIFSGLKEKPPLLGNLVIIVDEFEITNGLIDIKQIINSKEHNGSVEFQLLLHNINTSKESLINEGRFLFAEKHFVKLSNFNYFLPNGDVISFDSTVFETGTNCLISSNIRVKVVGDSIHAKYNPIIAEVRELFIDGIDLGELKRMHDFDIDSIAISDAFLNITKNDFYTSDAISDTSTHKFNLFKLIHSLKVDAFTLNNINLLNNTTDGDTIFILENLNFGINDIKLDSMLMVNKMPEIDYSSINLSSGALKIFEKKSGLSMNLNNFKFAENNGVLSLLGLQINDHKFNSSNKFIADVDSIEVSGVCVEDLINGQIMKVGVLLSNPSVHVDISPDLHKKRAKSTLNIDKLEISEIQISNGLIHLFEGDNLDVSITGLDVNSGKIQLSDFSEIHKINTNGLTLNTSEVKISMPHKDIQVTFGSMLFLNKMLKINTISGNYAKVGSVNSSMDINQLQLGRVNIGSLLSDKEIDLKYVKIIRPRFKGNIDFISDKDKNLKQKRELKFDYKVNIDDFELIDGKVDLNVKHKDDVIGLKSDVNITVEDINITDENDTTWFSKLLWRVNLSQSVVTYQDYLVRCENIESDNAKELLMFSGVEISDNVSSCAKSGVEIRDLRIESVNLSGFEYNAIIEKRTPVVRSIYVENPCLDIRIDSRNRKSKDNSNTRQNFPVIPIDNFEIRHLSFSLEKQDSVSTSNICLANLDFKYDMSYEDNIVGGLEHFSASNFLFSDTVKNSYTDVKELSFNKEELKIGISGISGGSINKHLDRENYLSYASSGFQISGIDISKNTPYNVSVLGINIDDLQIDIEDHKTKGKSSESSLKIHLELPDYLNYLNVNEISVSSVDLKHSTITDTSDKILILNNLGFLVSSLKIDSNTIAGNNYEFVKHVLVSLGENKFISSDSLYESSVKSISYDFTKNILEIDSLMMIPRYEPDEFFKKAVYQTGKMDLVADKIVCSDIRLKKLISDGSIHMGGADVYGLDMRIFRNKKYEMNPDLYKKMPQESLLSVPRVLTIDSLRTHDAYIQYRQLSKKSVVPGEIFLNEVYLSIYNISNNLKVIDETSSMQIFFNAKLLGESAMNLKMVFPILSPSHDFWVTGHIEKIDFTKLNSMTQNLVGITMKKGTGELHIPLITGNRLYSEGSILFKYKKLKVELYDRDKAENTTGLIGSMANLMLNDIFIKSKNPGFLGKTRPGEVYFKRDTQKSIVYYTWKSVLSGLMSTMGYNNKEQRHDKRALRRKWR